MIKPLISRLLRLLNVQTVRRSGIVESQPSFITPAAGWRSSANDRLIDLSLNAIQLARAVDHSDIVAKMAERPHWPGIWPGEHYKLLTGLVQALKPLLIVEIGTFTGYSALSMKKSLPAGSKIVTFDIVSWKETPKCILSESDFQEGRLEQVLADLSRGEVFAEYVSLLENADFIFIDAAKDGFQEQRFIDNFNALEFKSKPIFMFDDTRVMNMIEIWHNLQKSKLDLTSFGHWSGTGLVDWCDKK